MAYTITNTFGTFETWSISTKLGNGWWGCKVTGASSGATGVIWEFGSPVATAIIRRTNATAFTGSEVVNITGGGSFVLAAALTSTITDGIMTITGEDLTDSTANTNGATGIVAAIAVTNGAVFTEDDFIKIESEYMCVLSIAANVITCRRGELGTTIVSHATALDVYIHSRASFQKLYDASVTGVWGFDALVDGALELDCTIQIGDPGQAARTIFLTTDEAVVVKGDLGIFGASAYPSWFKSGVGHIDDTGSPRRGSSIQALGFVHGPLGAGITQFRYGVLEAAGGSIGPDLTFLTEHYLYRCSTGPKPPSESGNTGILGDGYGWGSVGTGEGRWTDVVVSGQAVSYSSDRVTFDRVLFGDGLYAMFFISAGNIDVEVRNCIFNTEINAFSIFESGTKTFANCQGVNLLTSWGFYSGVLYKEEYTVDRKFIAEDGSPLLGINNKAWNRIQDPNTDVPLFDVNSAADGTIAQQQIRVYRRPTQGGGGRIDYNPITFIARREGWARDRFVWTLEEFVLWTTRMQNYRI